MDEKVSKKIRECRHKKGMTLKELSELTGLSVSFLSQIERGRSSMTITSLKKISNALDVPMKVIVDVKEENDFLNTKATQRVLHFEKSYISYLRLSGKFQGRTLEGLILNMAPNYYDQEELMHEGEEFYYVMSGIATFIIEDKEYTVCEGEVIHYPSTLPHRTVNKQDTKLKMLCIATPAIFD